MEQTNDVELERIREALRELYVGPSTDMEGMVDLWLSSPHPLLGGELPLALIQKGRANEVEAVIDQLRSGAYV